MDLKFFLEMALLLLAGSAIYWRVHYKTEQLSSSANNFENTIKSLQSKDAEHDKAIADLKSDMEKSINVMERRIDKRLGKIEKILIRMDAKMGSGAADDLMDD